MIKELVKLSNHLDAKGLRKEADYLDMIISKMASDGSGPLPPPPKSEYLLDELDKESHDDLGQNIDEEIESAEKIESAQTKIKPIIVAE